MKLITVDDASFFKTRAEHEVGKILEDLMKNTGCNVSSISLDIEEGYGERLNVITHVEIKLEIK